MKKYIYLAGPIRGHTEGVAKPWRDLVRRKLIPGLVAISPLRCEPLPGAVYDVNKDDPLYGTAKAIHSKNQLDVRSCDAVLAYMPVEYNKPHPSVGTLLEIGWATGAGKPVILVTNDPWLADNAVLQSNVSWLLEDLSKAIELVNNLFADYVGGSPTPPLTLSRADLLVQRPGKIIRLHQDGIVDDPTAPPKWAIEPLPDAAYADELARAA